MARKKQAPKAASAASPAPVEQPAAFTPQPTSAPAESGYKWGRPVVRVAGQKRDATSPRAETARAASAQPTVTEEK